MKTIFQKTEMCYGDKYRKSQMQMLLKRWIQNNTDSITEYSDGAKKFLQCIEEIQYIPIFTDVIDMRFIFYGDFGHEHLLELYYADSGYLLLEYYDGGFFGLTTRDETDDDRSRFIIYNYDILKRILVESQNLDFLETTLKKFVENNADEIEIL